MFFSAYLGNPQNEVRWRETLHRHAMWLGLAAHAFSRPVFDGRTFTFGWASLRPPDTEALVHEDAERLTIIPLDTLTRAAALAQEHPRGFETNAIRMDVSLASGEVRVAVPVLTVEQFFHAEAGGDWVFGNDLRLMLRWAGLRLDDLAAYSFLQYGLVLPPLTLSRTVRRVSPGCRLIVRRASGLVEERLFDPGHLKYADRDTSDADEVMREALDSVLIRAPLPAVMHFSGGVDSGLMAARLAAMGRRDVRLQNFSHGTQDSFRDLAPAMAAHLGFPFERVEWDASQVMPAVNDLAREYSAPFADAATIPTMMLARATPESGALRSFLEGTAAASLLEWGLHYPMRRSIFNLPRPLRQFGAALYQAGLWRYEKPWVRPFAALQTSTQMPLFHTMQTTLGGYAYRVPPDVHSRLYDVLAEGLTAISAGMDGRDRFALQSLVRFGAHFSAARGFDPMRRRGIMPVFPYMEPAVVRAGFSLTWDQKYEGKVLKVPLKRLLARSVPSEWVYWPKGVFVFPFQATFAHADMRAFWNDVALSPQNPMLAYCRVDKVRNVLRRAEAGEYLHSGARKFLWGFTFISAWLSQLETQ